LLTLSFFLAGEKATYLRKNRLCIHCKMKYLSTNILGATSTPSRENVMITKSGFYNPAEKIFLLLPFFPLWALSGSRTTTKTSHTKKWHAKRLHIIPQKHTAIAFEEVHYGAGISRVYNGYLKSGSKQKSEKHTPYLEELKSKKEERRAGFVNQGKKKEGACAWLIETQSSTKFFCLREYLPSKEKMDAIFRCVYVTDII
jgi:hypothetical protein